MFLVEVQSAFLVERRLKDLGCTLSEFIGFPIGLYVEILKEKGLLIRRKMVGGQARHEDHFYLWWTSPSSWRNDARGICWFLSEFIGFPNELHVEKSKENSGKNEDYNRGGR